MSICKLCGHASELIYDGLADRMSGAVGYWNLVRCTNPECALVWIDPIPDAVTLAEAYETYYTHTLNSGASRFRRLYCRARNGYISRRFGYPFAEDSWWIRALGTLMALVPHRRIGMDALAMWLPWQAKGKLLEIGCGNGDRLALLRDLGWTVVGLEPDTKAAQLARDRGFEVYCESLQPGKSRAESFDAILLSHVIEHVPDPRQTIRECCRLLRRSGVLIMLTPNIESLGHRWFGRNWLHLDPPRHLNLFNSRNLSRLCSEAGFTAVECATTPRDADWTLGASVVLRSRDRYVIGQLPLATRVLGILLFYVEWAALFLHPRWGEEILVTARRTDSFVR